MRINLREVFGWLLIVAACVLSAYTNWHEYKPVSFLFTKAGAAIYGLALAGCGLVVWGTRDAR